MRTKTAILLLALLPTVAQAGAPTHPNAVAAAEPVTRIRSVPRNIELTQEQFSGWMRTVWRHGKPRRYAMSGPTDATIVTPGEEFSRADANGDGRVTKEELTDYLALPTTN